MRFVLTLALLGLVSLMTYCTFAPAAVAHSSPQFRDGKFRNPVAMNKHSFGETMGLWWTFLFDKPSGTVPQQPVPVLTLTRAEVLAAPA